MNELHGELNQLPRLPQPSARNVRGTIKYKAPKLEESHRNLSEPSQDQRDCPRDPAQAADLQNHRLIHDACDLPQHVEVICYEAEATRSDPREQARTTSGHYTPASSGSLRDLCSSLKV